MSFNRYCLLCILFFCVGTTRLMAQVDDANAVIEPIIESVAENAGEDFDYSELTERLNFYFRNPINLNKASEQQFRELVFLSPLQISAIIDRRRKTGPYLSALELQSVDGLDLETVRMLLPFVTVNKTSLNGLSVADALHKSSNELTFLYGQVLQKQKGYTITDTNKSRYLGSPERYLVRYRYHYGEHFSASLNMEKDAGEQFFAGVQSSGFDFYSGNVAYRGDGVIGKAVLGDYSLQFGQGLTMWSGLSFGKGASVATVPKQDIGLKPYTSTNEMLFLRGAAVTLNLKALSVTPFVSYRKLDASTVNRDTINPDGQTGSLNQMGLHRTPTEADNRNNTSQLVYGINAGYTIGRLNVGSVVYHTDYNRDFAPGKYLYNQYDFTGKSLSNAGLYYNYSWRNLYFYGEVAKSVDYGSAWLQGVLASLSPQVSLVLMYRDYQKNYQSFFNQALAESSVAYNERGFYSGFIISPGSKYEFTGYVDFFRFPWLKYKVDAPSSGYEVLTQFTYMPNKQVKAYLRYKLENKQENDDIANAINFLQQVQRQNYRFDLRYSISKAFQLGNRVELMRYHKEDHAAEWGYVAYQDLSYNPMFSKFSGNLRFAVFDTQGYNSRIYTYENDVLYGFSVPGLQDRGVRFYINGRYRVRRGLDFWVKYAVTQYTNRDDIGSGLDVINGNTRSDIKLQLRYQF
ncbi:helix-hairpin-helix domain-containing protein [Pedobacter sp. BS3]|uniref:ComEA family DNA-binding protein n=1 Tax=Pedobacter sp. BS3 TaxID=2567937 RepID=UPI0011ED06FC|nr:helix-hairpin-helix domain-containing protein [Pedobacter sp. BS3]TZF82759.1 helix-hairpin-helix domain-containing protein [Pedobacter sp. BS3]